MSDSKHNEIAIIREALMFGVNCKEGLLALAKLEEQIDNPIQGGRDANQLAGTPEGHFVPEGDERCGAYHTESRATCLKRKGHDGPHANSQGHWIDGPWSVVTERDANQLAADVSAGVEAILNGAQERAKARLALAELVALVGTLQQERDTLENRWLADNERAVAAEAALAKASIREERLALGVVAKSNELSRAEAALTITRQALAAISALSDGNLEMARGYARRALADAGGDTKEPWSVTGDPIQALVDRGVVTGVETERDRLAGTGGDTKEST